MITHVIVELKYPVEDEYFHMDTVFPNEYYGYGTPLIRCIDCKYNPENAMSYLDDDLIAGYMHCGHLGDDGYCSLAKKKE